MSQTSDRVPCPHCQASNFPSSTVCWQCGQPLQAQQSQPPTGPTPPLPGSPGPPPTHYAKPPNYLVWSILATLFCCLPAGIVSIVFAAQVDGKYASGDYAGAVAASGTARTWAWVSFGLGLAVAAVYVVLAVLGVLGRVAHSM